MPSNVIVVVGVPGTGKSLLGSRLARRLGYSFTTVTWLVLLNGYWASYDGERRSFVIDYEALVRGLRGMEGDYVVETHWLEPFLDARPSINIRSIIFTRTHPLILYERLLRRHWPLRKIAENIEAELIGALVPEAYEAMKQGLRVIEVDTSRSSLESLVSRILDVLEKDIPSQCCIDWLSRLGEAELERVMKVIEGSMSRG